MIDLTDDNVPPPPNELQRQTYMMPYTVPRGMPNPYMVRLDLTNASAPRGIDLSPSSFILSGFLACTIQTSIGLSYFKKDFSLIAYHFLGIALLPPSIIIFSPFIN